MVVLDCWILYPPVNPGALSERWGRGSRGHRAPGACRHLLSDSLLWVGNALPSLGRQLARSLTYTLVPAFSGYLGRGRPKTSILYFTVHKVSSRPCPSSRATRGRGAILLCVTHWWVPSSGLLHRNRATFLPIKVFSHISPKPFESFSITLT